MPLPRSLVLSALLCVVCVSPLIAQRGLKDIPDPDPEIERKSFQVADGFEVNLFAADPRIAKPIQMNFDARGRLWIASSEVYPHIAPGEEPHDKVIVVEDVDGDGVAEKTTVFADGLLIPTGIEPGDGGVYVANSTELIHLRDEDGDGRADTRRVVLSGFGTEDTHHILHTLRWGMDGQLYFNQSIYIHSHVETPWGVRRLGGGGIWQFRPETSRLEVFCRGFVNPWGHHFDEWGQSFASDGAYHEGVNYVFPGSVFVTAPGAKRILKGLNPGSPKHCGLEILSGSHLPEEWRGNVLLNDFRGHRVCRFVLSEDGSGFASREQPELIKTSHVAFRPIDIAMGPDGAIYIADWYNPIIQHGEVDFRDPRRDHTHGRIWRVTAKDRPLVPRPQLAEAAAPALLEAFKAPEQFTRQHARRLLKERGKSVLPALQTWVAALDPAPASDRLRLEALWTYQALDVVEPKLLALLLQSHDHRARAAAVRVASQWQTQLPDVLALLERAVQDEHPRVRLETVRALGGVPDLRAAVLTAKALDRTVDSFLDFALWQTFRDLESYWLPEVQAGRSDLGGKPEQLLFALEALDSPATVGPLVHVLRSGKLTKEREEDALTRIASLGGPGELGLVLNAALTEGEPAHRSKLLSVLADATQRRGVRPDGDLGRIASLLDSTDESLQAATVRSAGVWKLEPLRPRLAGLATAAGTSDSLRRSAVDALTALAGPADRALFEQMTAKDRPRGIRLLGATALVTLDPIAGAPHAVQVLADGTPQDDLAPLFNAFLQHKQGPQTLAAAVEGKTLPEDVAKTGLRLLRSTGRDLPELSTALTKAGNLSEASRLLTPEQMKEVVAAVVQAGNASRGELIFRRTDQNCLKCHAISGAGGLVGPDLASVGASAQVDYLVDSLLQPTKAIKENYHTLVVATTEGKVISGVKVRQTDKDLLLRDADDKEIAIPLDKIDEQAPGGSLMPAGLTDTLTRPELVDLVRFLSELGKVGPYAPSQARVVRRWQVAIPANAAARDALRTRPEGALRDPNQNWQPIYSRVSGELPLADIVPFDLPGDPPAMNLLRFQLQVNSPGKVGLLLDREAQPRLWLNGNSIELKSDLVLDLPPGVHTLALAINRRNLTNKLRCELQDVPGSTAQVQIVGGK